MGGDRDGRRDADGLPALPPEVRYEARGPVRLVVLDRPQKLNAADLAMQRGVLDVWAHVAADAGARAVVVTGAGTAFSAGGDMSVLEAVAADTGGIRAEISAVTTATMRAVLGCPLPVIAAVNGLAVGFGASLVALCDLVVMAEDAYLCDPHGRYGMPASPGCALAWPDVLPAVVAKELLMLGTRVGARDALRLGLANRVVPAADVVPAALALAAELAALPAAGIAEIKQAMNEVLLERLERTRGDGVRHDAMGTPASQAAIADLVRSVRG